MNFIWGNVPARISLLQGMLPSFMGYNFFTFLYLFFYYAKGSIIFLKLPSIFGGICFLFLDKDYDLYKKSIVISLFFFLFGFSFVFWFKKTFFYAIFWFLAAFFLLLRDPAKISLFERSFISMWFAHAAGTLIYGILCGFLTDVQYVALLPIALCERVILTFVLYASFIARRYIAYFFDKIKLTWVEKVNE